MIRLAMAKLDLSGVQQFQESLGMNLQDTEDDQYLGRALTHKIITCFAHLLRYIVT